LGILKFGCEELWLNLCVGFILWKVTTIKVGVFALVGLLVKYFDDNLKIFTLYLFEWLIELLLIAGGII
jgi:hypothetical protein